MELHEALKARRIEMHLTQQQMADKLGIDKSTYAHYESGRRTPDAKKYVEIATLLHIPHFPIKQIVSYPEGLLDKFEKIITDNSVGTSDVKSNLRQVESINEILNEVLDIRNSVFDVSGVDLPDPIFPGGYTVVTATMDARGEQLINRAMRTTSNLLAFCSPK